MQILLLALDRFVIVLFNLKRVFWNSIFEYRDKIQVTKQQVTLVAQRSLDAMLGSVALSEAVLDLRDLTRWKCLQDNE
jgi:hypothetical protein